MKSMVELYVSILASLLPLVSEVLGVNCSRALKPCYTCLQVKFLCATALKN